ncbi:hypothetical protein VKT23_006319 [Stygiomarasmius scandens]|uniref:Retrotransposon gag domain-containing protein n=1 Tax=Marasmiellus scandens TaxID=2682957 RepID=A0ABR1JME9_9AGAR
MDPLFIAFMALIFFVTLQGIYVVYQYFGGMATTVLVDTLLVFGMGVAIFWQGGRRFGTPVGTTQAIEPPRPASRDYTPERRRRDITLDPGEQEHIRSRQRQDWRDPAEIIESSSEEETVRGSDNTSTLSTPQQPGPLDLDNLFDDLHIRGAGGGGKGGKGPTGGGGGGGDDPSGNNGEGSGSGGGSGGGDPSGSGGGGGGGGGPPGGGGGGGGGDDSDDDTPQRNRPRAKGKVTYARAPPDFEGDKTKYEDFKRLAVNYGEAYKTSFNTKEEYNQWLLSYFVSGAASKFAAAAEKQGWIRSFTTTQMWEKLDERFMDGKLPKKAAELLEVTRQGKTEIQEFIAWFEEKCAEAGYYWYEPDAEGKYAGEDPTHIRLLNKSIRTKIVDAIHVAEEVPVNYIPYRNKALRIGINIENHEEDSKGGNQLRWIDGKTIGAKGGAGSSGTSGSGHNQNPSKTTSPTPVGGPGVPAPAYSAGSGQGTAMQVDRTLARTRGLCYKCGQKWGEGKDCDQCKRRGMKVRSQAEESNKPETRPVEDKAVDKGKGRDPAEGPGFPKGAQ